MEAHRMIRLRGGSGLGDSLYLRPVVCELMRRGQRVAVMSNYPDVFIGTGAIVEPFRRERVDMVAHYVGGKTNPDTTIWQDLCAHAKVQAALEFDGWQVCNTALIEKVRRRAAGRRIILVHGGREPMGRRDRYGRELLPEELGFLAAMGGLIGCYTVRIGRDDQIYDTPCALDLFGKTSVSDLLDLASICDGVLAQCSFAIPLAEGFDKPLLVVWSSRGLRSANEFINTVTPAKLLSKPSSDYAMDDWPPEVIAQRASVMAWGPQP